MSDFISQAAYYFHVILKWLHGISIECWIAFGIGLLVAKIFLSGKGRRRRYSPRRRPGAGSNDGDEDITKFKDMRYKSCQLMSPTEIRFWRILYRAVPGYHIFPQVAINALVEWKAKTAITFARFCGLSILFELILLSAIQI